MVKNSFKSSILIIRYIIYFAIALSILVLSNASTVRIPTLLFFLLLYIINTQIRIYFLDGKTIPIIFSILFELIIIYLLYSNFGGFTFVYFFLTILDASIMLPKVQAFVLMLISYAAVISMSFKPDYTNLQNHPLINVIFNTLIVVGFGSLGRYIEEEKHKKIHAQELYDRIRISEEKLKDAYSRLEQYSNTVEEITILRERNRISREIHDTVGHTLSTLIIQLQSLPFIIDADKEEAKNTVENMVSYTKTGLEDVRRAVRELNPTSFDDNNGIFVLRELMHNFEKNSKIKINCVFSKNQYELTSDQSFTLYRVFQEAFNNSLRHGKATAIRININFLEDQIYIRIKDNGCGCVLKPGFGLKNMEHRIKNIGGNIQFSSEAGNGFEITLSIPKVQNIAKLQIDKE